MDTPDRLAAYLAGDLDPADASAFEEELARDPALRAQLAAMRRADGALLALRSPQAPDGFEERLRAALQPVLADELGNAGVPEEAPTSTGTFDELASRRAERDQRRGRWLPAVAGVAAAAAAVVVIGNVVEFGGDDADMDTGDSGVETMADDAEMESFDETEGDDAEDAGAPPPPDGPTVVSSERALGEQDLEALLAAPELEGVTAQGYGSDEGTVIADGWSLALGADPAQDDAMADDEAADDEAAGDTAEEGTESDADGSSAAEAVPESAPMQTRGSAPLSEDDEATVARCLNYLMEGEDAPDAIPAYVELATYDGDDVLVFGFVTEDPSTGAYTRTELWVVGRDDCEPRYLRQG